MRSKARVFLAIAPLFIATALAADPSTELLEAAAKGQMEQVQALLASGANLEVQDKNERTPLMLAAQHGHAGVVRLLLLKGANANARDRIGWTAFGLTYASPIGGHHEDILSALPPPEGLRVVAAASWTPEDLISSCFMARNQLIQHVDEMGLDSMILNVFRVLATGGPLQIVRVYRHGMVSTGETDAVGDADALLTLQVRPASSCSQQGVDNLSLAIDARLFRARDHSMVFKETFGGGLKGLNVRTAANPSQHSSLYEAWVNSHSGAIERGVLASLLKTAP